MVLQHAVRSPFPARHAHGDVHRPDPVRIAAIAGALALNAAALMLMLAPPGQLQLPASRPPTMQGEWFEPRPLPPPPPPEIVPVQPVVPPPDPVAPRRQVRVAGPVPHSAPIADPGPANVDVPVTPEATTPDHAGSEQATPAASGMQLAYAEASLPPYPPAALRAGHQGTVVLKVLVDIDGRPLRVDVDAGSGYRELDDMARRHVLRRWRFQPALRDGQPVQAIGLVPITFSLDRS